MEPLSIADQLAYSTVRISTIYADGSHGTGSGFFFRFRENNGQHIPAIVTNKHVTKGAVRGAFRLTRQTIDGLPDPVQHSDFQFDNFNELWTKHPNPDIDLCAMPIGPILNKAKDQDKPFFFRTFGSMDLMSEEELNNLMGLEHVTMVGYPNGIWDEVHNYPIFRRGTTATHPKNDWNGRSEFIVDMACFPGSSGSPVLLTDFGSVVGKTGDIELGRSRIKLLGILYAGPQYTTEGKIEIIDVPVIEKPVVRTSIPNNLGIVIHARELLRIENESPFRDS